MVQDFRTDFSDYTFLGLLLNGMEMDQMKNLNFNSAIFSTCDVCKKYTDLGLLKLFLNKNKN